MEILLDPPFAVVFIIGFILLVSAILRWLWNMTVPDVFGSKNITYWQALRILIISAVLFHGDPIRFTTTAEARQVNNTVEDIIEKLDMIIEQNDQD